MLQEQTDQVKRTDYPSATYAHGACATMFEVAGLFFH